MHVICTCTSDNEMWLCTDVMARGRWTVDDVWDLLQTMASIQTEKLQQHKCDRWARVHCYPPWKGDIVFGLSVCPSVRLSVCPGRFFSHFVRVTSPTVFITHKPNLYHLKAGCLECVMGGPFFRTPQNFGEIGLWKRPKITNSNFWSVTSQRVLGPGMRYPHHMKARYFSSEMTSENASGDASLWKFCPKRLSQIPDFCKVWARARGILCTPTSSFWMHKVNWSKP